MTAMGKHRYKSIEGAVRRIRELEKIIAHLEQIAQAMKDRERTLAHTRRLMAMLAAEGPAFDNPLIIMEAKMLRDEILREECKLAPDGNPLVVARGGPS
jgi:hypothetical protein